MKDFKAPAALRRGHKELPPGVPRMHGAACWLHVSCSEPLAGLDFKRTRRADATDLIANDGCGECCSSPDDQNVQKIAVVIGLSTRATKRRRVLRVEEISLMELGTASYLPKVVASFRKTCSHVESVGCTCDWKRTSVVLISAAWLFLEFLVHFCVPFAVPAACPGGNRIVLLQQVRAAAVWHELRRCSPATLPARAGEDASCRTLTCYGHAPCIAVDTKLLQVLGFATMLPQRGNPDRARKMRQASGNAVDGSRASKTAASVELP